MAKAQPKLIPVEAAVFEFDLFISRSSFLLNLLYNYPVKGQRNNYLFDSYKQKEGYIDLTNDYWLFFLLKYHRFVHHLP